VAGDDGLSRTVLQVVRARLAQAPAVGAARAAEVGPDTLLVSSGLVDSFALVDLVAALETALGRSLPLSLMAAPEAMDSVRAIVAALEARDCDGEAALPDSPACVEDIALRHSAARSPRHRMGFWSLYYRLVFRRHGIAYGAGLRVLGPLLLRLEGEARNLRLGRNATLMPWVDLKLREAGRIELGDDVVLDTTVRLVAAREGAAILGDRAQLGMGSIVNAGDLVVFGRDSAVAGHCNVVASEHRLDLEGPVMDGGYVRRPVLVGAGAWIAAGCMLRPGARIGEGAVVGAHSVVEGALPSHTLAAGAPARPIRRLRRG
jgi:acetyltransferase-like isoleucine patch superfamily enzyme/acyl carrier protein